jgi:hypothetical protein
MGFSSVDFIGMRNAHFEARIVTHAAQNAVNGDVPTVTGAENQPIADINVEAVEPFSVALDKGARALPDHQPNLGLVTIFLASFVGEVEAAFGFLRADINRKEDAGVEHLELAEIANFSEQLFFWVNLVKHCDVVV